MSGRHEVQGRHRAPGKPQVGGPWRRVSAGVVGAVGAVLVLVSLVLVMSGLVLGCAAPLTPTTVPSPSPSVPPWEQTPTSTVTPTQTPTPTATTSQAAVLRVIDGDTIQLGTPGKPGESVRLIGIDTPDKGHCGRWPARDYLRELIGTHGPNEVTLTAVPGFKRDRYQRLLRYVSVPGTGMDVGLALIQKGHAIARYDSRTRGYKRHPRQDTYIAADAASPAYVCSSSPSPTKGT